MSEAQEVTFEDFDLDIDFDNIPDPDEPAPGGRYELNMTKLFAKTSSTNRPMAVLYANLVDEEHGGKFVADYMLLDTAQGRGRVAQIVRHLGASNLTEASALVADGGTTIEAQVKVNPPSDGFSASNGIARIYT